MGNDTYLVRPTFAAMERKLTAILSADVAGYSRLMGEDEEATIRTLTASRDVMTTLIGQHRGRVVDSPGDNLPSRPPSTQAACTPGKCLMLWVTNTRCWLTA
jgi:class 3 adenylate cyclase